MKKVFYLVAIAAFVLSSCKSEEPEIINPEEPTGLLTFKASIEGFANAGNSGTGDKASSGMAKATIDSENGLVWAENDLIGIYFPEWGDKNQPFRLNAADAGKTEGNFTIATEENPSGASATAAYFPWWDTEGLSADYPTNDQTRVDEGIVKFKMKSDYYGYSNSRMLTPLVAPISSSSDNISFKHAGAAVKMTINNLVGGTYHTKMSVTGKQITGDFHIDPAHAGTDALALDAAEDDVSKNHVTLHAWKSSGAFTWIFPVPELTKPKLQFEIEDENHVTVWSKKLKAQANDLSRRDLLVMPAQDIDAYEKFTQEETPSWQFHGTINGSDEVDAPMYTDGKHWILAGCTFKDGDKFKIKKEAESYPSSDWTFNSGNAGAKDIIFNSDDHSIKVVSHKFPYPEIDLSSLAEDINIDGTMTDWTFHNNLVSTGTDRIRSWKFTSDATNLYFYLVLKKKKMYTKYNLTVGFSWNTSGSFSGDNLSGLEAVVVFQPFTNEDAGTPTCVNGTLNNATINGSAVADAGIVVYGSDPGDTSDEADYLIEFSIPKSKIPSLPASGNTIQIGVGYQWYNTSLQDVTL